MKHKDKLTMARRIRNKGEVKANASPFQSMTWINRKIAIKKRVEENIIKVLKGGE